MPAKTINILFLTIICVLFMPLSHAHPGHQPTGVDHMLLGLAAGLLSLSVVSMIIVIRRMTVTRNSGSTERN
jgi:hypothetical protein